MQICAGRPRGRVLPAEPLHGAGRVPVTVVFTGQAQDCLAHPEFPELGLKGDMSSGQAVLPTGPAQAGHVYLHVRHGGGTRAYHSTVTLTASARAGRTQAVARRSSSIWRRQRSEKGVLLASIGIAVGAHRHRLAAIALLSRRRVDPRRGCASADAGLSALRTPRRARTCTRSSVQTCSVVTGSNARRPQRPSLLDPREPRESTPCAGCRWPICLPKGRRESHGVVQRDEGRRGVRLRGVRTGAPGAQVLR